MLFKEQPRGRVFDFQRGSLQDGPGIRTTVFLKGCPLRCSWCHNPEGLLSHSQLLFNEGLCVGCECCAVVCPNGVHHFSGKEHILEFEKCTLCGKCIEHCSHSGPRAVGTEMSVGDVLHEVCADILFYENSGGGITLSGGEPLWQLAFAVALLEESKENGSTPALRHPDLSQRVKESFRLWIFSSSTTSSPIANCTRNTLAFRTS
jgi:glycyl-radical enzyme activating protein